MRAPGPIGLCLLTQTHAAACRKRVCLFSLALTLTLRARDAALRTSSTASGPPSPLRRGRLLVGCILNTGLDTSEGYTIFAFPIAMGKVAERSEVG